MIEAFSLIEIEETRLPQDPTSVYSGFIDPEGKRCGIGQKVF
jgi:hypothetical protein